MENNRKCYTCGKEYHYCYSCPDEHRPTYLTMFCCENCLTVFDALCDYGSDKILAKECNEIIKDKIPEDVSKYSEGCQKLIAKMNSELKKQEVIKTVKNEKPLVMESKPNIRNNVLKNK